MLMLFKSSVTALNPVMIAVNVSVFGSVTLNQHFGTEQMTKTLSGSLRQRQR